jgi:type IV pilus assembly protein PilB
MGYRGRTGLFEFLTVDDSLRHLILERTGSAALREHALKSGRFVSLWQDGIHKMREGLTTPEEIMRVTME